MSDAKPVMQDQPVVLHPAAAGETAVKQAPGQDAPGFTPDTPKTDDAAKPAEPQAEQPQAEPEAEQSDEKPEEKTLDERVAVLEERVEELERSTGVGRDPVEE